MDPMKLESLDSSHFMETQKLPFGLQRLLSLLANHHNCTLLDHLYLQKHILISQLQRPGYPRVLGIFFGTVSINTVLYS